MRGGTDFDGPHIVSMAEVERTEVQWLYYGRIARGKLTLVIGAPDLGKSLISIDYASRVSRGLAWPDGETLAPKGKVLFLMSEDGIADTLGPRLDAAEADSNQIEVLRSIRRDGATHHVNLAEDLEMVEAALLTHEIALLVIDPLSAYLGSTDSHRDAALRGVLSPFADLLERTGCACLGVMHPPKHVVNVVYYASGSGAFTAQARVVLGVGRDPHDESEQRRLLLKIKSNLVPEVPTLGYSIVARDNAPVVAWEKDPVEGVSAAEILGPQQTGAERSELQEARTFLVEVLTPAGMYAKEVYAAARENGISARTLERAKRELGVVPDKTPPPPGHPFNKGGWKWSLPIKKTPLGRQASKRGEG
jgi:putative DNA primase/helicase